MPSFLVRDSLLKRAVLGLLVLTMVACGGGSTTPDSNALTITTQPSSVSVAQGGSASFTVVATGGSGSLSYQWYAVNAASNTGAAISGATSATYTLASVTTSNAGTYYVVITDASSNSVTSNWITLSVSTSSTGSNTGAVVAAANSFLDTLSASQKTVATSSSSSTTVLFDYTLANAETWSNLPGSRHGLRLNSSTLSATQLAAAATLISTAVSTAGNTELAEIRLADDVIASTTSNSPWGATLYSIAFIGMPSTSSAWMLQVTGHHIAYNISYNAPYLSATPMFLGVEPPNWWVNSSGGYTVNGTASTSGETHAPLETQRQAVDHLATALQSDSTTVASAKLTGTFNDVIMGVSNSGDTNYKSLAYPTTGRGALYSSLNDTQKSYVKATIEAWVNTQAGDIATALLAEYESDTSLANTYVGYQVGQGGTADFSAYPNAQSSPLDSQRSYLRIDGPRVWIEFVVQQGVAYKNYVHYHSIWRDKTADYGGSF